jgi:hypothetical protein
MSLRAARRRSNPAPECLVAAFLEETAPSCHPREACPREGGEPGPRTTAPTPPWVAACAGMTARLVCKTVDIIYTNCHNCRVPQRDGRPAMSTLPSSPRPSLARSSPTCASDSPADSRYTGGPCRPRPGACGGAPRRHGARRPALPRSASNPAPARPWSTAPADPAGARPPSAARARGVTSVCHCIHSWLSVSLSATASLGSMR